MKRKILKHNKIIAWFVVLSMLFSLGTHVWSEPAQNQAESNTAETAETGGRAATDLPLRDEDKLLEQMELFAETPELALYVLDSFEYVGEEKGDFVNLFLYDENGKLVALEYSEYENFDDLVPIYNHNGDPVFNENGEHRIEQLNRFNQVKLPADEIPAVPETATDDEDTDRTVADDDADEDEDAGETATDGGEEELTRLTYVDVIYNEVEKVKEEAIFAIKVKSNNYVWWSNPINAAHAPGANVAQVNSLSSPVEFVAGNPEEYIPYDPPFRSNTQRDGRFYSECTKIEKIPGGVRFYYDFKQAHTTFVMDVVLDGDSILVTIPSDKLVERMIEKDPNSTLSPAVMLSLSVLRAFGAAPKGEDGYIVVADGSGAVINFDNGRVNASQYYGQVYGRDYSVSQKFAPPVNQQVYLPVYGIVRDAGENALVAIAEKGDENATIRAAVSGNTPTTVAGYNLAWFDFRMRTTDSFFIGTENTQLTIYESGKIKTGDIAVRYYPLAGKDLSYVDVANKYSEHLQRKDLDHTPVEKKEGADSLPFYMTLNGGTIKTHSIAGFPFNLQTEATTYSQAKRIIETLQEYDVTESVITYNDFGTPSIKRQVSNDVRYSKKLGGKDEFNALMSAVGQYNYELYPSMGFMEFQRAGRGFSSLRHSPREVTRSRAVQQKYELAFGTPDRLQKVSSIVSPFYFNKIFDDIVGSLKAEGITTISLDNATTLLYSDFSSGRKNFNRRDTVRVLTEGFKKINDAGISIMAQSANAYALPYVSHISNVPLSSSDYDIFDYDVPFYQLVVKGLIPYTTKPFNASSNLDALTLLAISTATPIHYEFIYSGPGNFNDSIYNSKFYADYFDWIGDSINAYKAFNELVGDVAGTRIESHKRLGVNEFETTFEGGKKIYINLSTYELRVDGTAMIFQRGGGVR